MYIIFSLEGDSQPQCDQGGKRVWVFKKQFCLKEKDPVSKVLQTWLGASNGVCFPKPLLCSHMFLLPAIVRARLTFGRQLGSCTTQMGDQGCWNQVLRMPFHPFHPQAPMNASPESWSARAGKSKEEIVGRCSHSMRCSQSMRCSSQLLLHLLRKCWSILSHLCPHLEAQSSFGRGDPDFPPLCCFLGGGRCFRSVLVVPMSSMVCDVILLCSTATLL